MRRHEGRHPRALNAIACNGCRKVGVLVSLAIVAATLWFPAAADAQVGRWRTHTSMRDIRDLVRDGQTIWAATSGGVFAYSLEDGRFHTVTNVDGLTTIDIASICVDGSGRVIAGSSTGVLDIRDTDGTWSAVLDIARAKDKQRRGITAMLPTPTGILVATEFGMVAFNPARREFGATYQKFGALPSQTAVNDLLVIGDSLWLATNQGVAVAALSDANLQDPQRWKSFDAADGLPVARIRALVQLDGILLAGTEKGLYRLSGSAWIPVLGLLEAQNIRRLVPSASGIYALTDATAYLITSTTEIVAIGDNIDQPLYPQRGMFADIVVVDGGRRIAATVLGLAELNDSSRWTFTSPNGPASNFTISLSVDAAGRVWSGSGKDAAGRGAYVYDGTMWRNYSRETVSGFPGNGVLATRPDPDGSTWLAFWGDGVAHMRTDGVIDVFNPRTLTGFPGFTNDPNFAPIGGAAVDAQGRAWFLHAFSGNSVLLSCREPDGTWTYFRNSPIPAAVEAYNLSIDQYGTKWFTVDRNFIGIVGFNENGTLDDPSDDSWYRFDSGDPGGLRADAKKILSTAVDALGALWIGTEVGLRAVYFPRPPIRFDSPCYYTTCNIEGESINALAVDAVNNKWVGTNSGVFVLSSDGSTILAQYTVDNSPLLDNTIRSIAVHPGTGVAWIGTAKGISAFSTPYVQAETTPGTLRIYPNPFHPERDGTVTIDGLPEGASLKILSVSGDVVADRGTPGGRIGFWDGRTNDGSLVASGVYVVAGASADGSKVALGKVAVVRR